MKRKLVPLITTLLLAACNQNTKTETGTSADSATRDTTAFKPANIQEQMIYNRGIEAVIWGMPAVNYSRMYEAVVNDAKGSYNSVVYWPKLQDWNNQTLTPNPDVIYFMSFFNLKESGPMVLEIPAAEGGAINGTVMDCWQTAIEDVGPAGVDKGKGGKYFIAPADYKERIPAGYILMSSPTCQGFYLLRSLLNSGGDAGVAKAIEYGKRIKFYPFSKSGDQPATSFIDMSGKLFDATIPYHLRFYQSLDRMVQVEPWLQRDRAMIDPLKSIGIERGKPFNPDEKRQAILNAAVKNAYIWLNDYYEKAYTPFYEGEQWFFPANPEFAEGIMSNYANPESYPTDARGMTYYFAFFSAKHIGTGQYYLVAIKDKDGKTLDCSKTYRLHVPAKVPVKQYWSVTLYDRETHTLIRNAAVLSRGSQSQGIQTNTDGSMDVYFGPKAPSGKESGWIPTGAGKNFEAMLRFYGPEEALFKKTWQLPDIEEVK